MYIVSTYTQNLGPPGSVRAPGKEDGRRPDPDPIESGSKEDMRTNLFNLLLGSENTYSRPHGPLHSTYVLHT